jgi:4-hydroxyacetophenone monooxygenase
MSNDTFAGSSADLRHILAEAHLPALLLSVVHMTNDPSLLKQFPRAAYTPLVDNRSGGFDAQACERIVDLAAQALSEHLDRQPRLRSPGAAVLLEMINFIAGADVPQHYTDFLIQELGIQDVDKDRPDFQSRDYDAGRDLQVIVIGAGMSGILAAIRLSQAGIRFTVIEKNTDVGGTWLENTYPGCRVDNPSHLYSYSFEPNHEWPQYFSRQPVLLDYFRGVTDKHGLRKHIRFATTVEQAAFNEKDDVWEVSIRSAAGRQTLRANMVITAVGQLNQPKYPDIPGRDSFTGASFHSARWDHSVDLRGKRVAALGTGASACQFVPAIAPEVAKLSVFQKSPPWLVPTFDYHLDVATAQRWLLEHIPYYEKWYRFFLYWRNTDGSYDAVKIDPEWQASSAAVSKSNAALIELLASHMRGQVLPEAAGLLDKVIPQYPYGGKRGIRDNGAWLKTLQRENVELIDTAIEKITPTGIRTKDGVEREVDVIIYGTGFRASRFLHPIVVRGRGGRELHQSWNGEPRAYYGALTPDFPNFFMIYGPNTNIVVNGSIIFFSECVTRFILGCIKLVLERGARTIEVRKDVYEAFNKKVDEGNLRMAWGAPNVSSWYKNASGRVSQVWPFPLIDYWLATRTPNPADFQFAASKDVAPSRRVIAE